MTELTQAYGRNEMLAKALRRVRGELEILALYGNPEDGATIVDCIDMIDEALADKVS